MSKSLQLKYFNTIYSKHTPVPKLDDGSNNAHSSAYDGVPWMHSNITWGGPTWIDYRPNNVQVVDGPSTNAFTLSSYLSSTSAGTNFVLEESRIRGGFNNPIMDLSPRAFLVEKENKVRIRENTIVYSGVFNSRTGVNQSNVFASGTDITRSVDKNLGSIQKLFATDNALNIFQENKVSQAMIDKDAVYTQEGQPITTKSNVVIGAVQPYVGEYGISKNPESFASFGFRRYFTDKYRNAVMRLSRDGLTEISQYGMKDYFRDKLKLVSDFRKSLVSSVYPISEQFPGIPNPNPSTMPTSTYVQVGNALSPNNDSITIGSNVSIYMRGGSPAQVYLTPCDATGNISTPPTASGSGYVSGSLYDVSGGSGSNLRIKLNVDANGAITSADTTPPMSLDIGTGYALGDILSIDDPGSLGGTGGFLCVNQPVGILDDGSGVWYTLEHFVTGITYQNNRPYLVFTTGGNYGLPGQNGVEYEASKIKFLEYNRDYIDGGYDVHKDNYVVSLKRESSSKSLNEVSDYRNNINGYYSTVAFDESVKGWTTFYTFRPNFIFNLKDVFYTVKSNQLYSHYTNLSSTNTFYGVKQPSLIEFIFNAEPSVSKNFKTINYEGSNGWQVSSVSSDTTGPILPLNLGFFDSSSGIKSYSMTEEPTDAVRSSFKLKEGKYVANIINSSTVRPGEIIFGQDMTGLKGYFITVTVTSDEFTDPEARKELFAVSSEFVLSSK
jgi:hypothetical protein